MFSQSLPGTLRPAFFLALIAILAWGTFDRSGRAQAPSATPAWEYHSVGIEFATLPAKLTELGNDGWEVVTVLHTDQTVENQADDNKPHLLARRIEVIAKRPRSR